MSTAKISSYQKMKQRYEAKISTIQNDIMTLVDDKDFEKVTVVKTKYKYKKDQENTVWFGNSSLKNQSISETPNKNEIVNGNLFNNDLIARVTVKKPNYAIGVDTYDKKALAYCFGRKIDGVFEVILSKTMRDRKEFDKEVNNLAAYFNAKIYTDADQ